MMLPMVRLFLLFISAVAIAASQHVRLDGFDAFIEKQRKANETPGVAVVAVDRNGVILMRGYGSRDAAGKFPITPNTMFPIASATKPFTAIGLATLVDKGMVEWDVPVRTYLPGFKLHDSYAAEHITLSDLLSQRSGLPRYDGVWVGIAFPQCETVRRLGFLEPSAGFRSIWQYSNLNFAAAACLQGQVDGNVGWENSEKKRVTDPLEMHATTFSLEALKQVNDRALPYAKTASGLVEAPLLNLMPVAGAGAINSNASDMSHFLQMLVNGGKFAGRTIVSQKRLDELTSPVMVIPRQPWEHNDLLLGQYTYGLGWFLTTYRGHKLALHWGSEPGISTIVAFLPDDGYAIAVLCNLGGSQLPDILTYNFLDRALGLPEEDWAAKFKRQAEEPKSQSDPPLAESKPSPASGKSSHPIGDYVGDYESNGYGKLVIQQEGEVLVAAYHGYRLKLEHAGFDVFKAMHEDFNALSDQNLQFRLDVDGNVEAVLWDIEAGVPRAMFMRTVKK